MEGSGVGEGFGGKGEFFGDFSGDPHLARILRARRAQLRATVLENVV